MITVYSFNKQIEKIEFEKALLRKRPTWIKVTKPGKDTLKKISEKTKVYMQDLLNCLDPDERARLDNESNYSVVIFKAPIYAKSNISTTSVGLIITKHYVMTVSNGDVEGLEKLHKIIDPVIVSKKGLSYLVFRILMQISRDFYNILDKMGENLDKLEDSLLKNKKNIQIEKVFASKKTLLYFRKALITNRDVVHLLERNGSRFVKSKELFEDLYTEISQLSDVEELLRGRLTETVSTYLSAVSNNLNVSMKSFTVIASLLLLPMLLSGIYGMNFQYLPLSGHPYGFWITLGIMAFGMIAALYIFQKKGWM